MILEVFFRQMSRLFPIDIENNHYTILRIAHPC